MFSRKEEALQLAKKVLKVNVSRINKGTNNWVFESENLIFSTPRVDWVKGYGIRIAATQKLMAHGIPVPKIVDYSPADEEKPEYIIVEKVDGENVDLSKKTKAQRDKIHQSAGEVLRAIHNIEGQGFGRADANLRGKHNSWVEYLDLYLARTLQDLQSDPEVFEKYGLRIEHKYQESRWKAEEIKAPHFLHTDYHFGNILFSNDLVKVVLDLDLVASGDPTWDTGYYGQALQTDRPGGLKAFRRGYGPDRDPVAERLSSLALWCKKVSKQVINKSDKLEKSLIELDRMLKEK